MAWFYKTVYWQGGWYDPRPGNVFKVNAPKPASPAEELNQRKGLYRHNTVGIYCENAKDVTLRDVQVKWGENRPEYYRSALETHNVQGLVLDNFKGNAAHKALPGWSEQRLNRNGNEVSKWRLGVICLPASMEYRNGIHPLRSPVLEEQWQSMRQKPMLRSGEWWQRTATQVSSGDKGQFLSMRRYYSSLFCQEGRESDKEGQNQNPRQ